MNLKIQRYLQNPTVTLGNFYREDGTKICKTLELPWLNNQHGISCIPAAPYTVELTDHPIHGWVFQVMNVPDRDDILLHIGNFPKDTHGCILLGLRVGDDGHSIENSSSAFDAFMKEMADAGITKFSLDILDVPVPFAGDSA